MKIKVGQPDLKIDLERAQAIREVLRPDRNFMVDANCTRAVDQTIVAAKGGIGQHTQALANEWAAHGVNVNAIAPGYVATDNTQTLQDDPVRSKSKLERIPQGRWSTAADFAGPVVFLAPAAFDCVNGEVLVVDCGWMDH